MHGRRRQKGSGTVEGVVGLYIVVWAIVLGTLLFVNAAATTYCKEKIGFVANQAADYASVLPVNASRQGLVLNEVKQLLASMNFSTGSTRVTITDLTLVSRPAVKVTVTTPFATFFKGAGGNFIPSLITLSDSAVAINNGWYPAYVQVVDLQGQQTTGIMISPGTTPPSDTLPVYGMNFYTPSLISMRGGTAGGGILGGLGGILTGILSGL